MSESILPFTATPLEKALETATNPFLPVPNGSLWNPMTCPAEFLPWLAHSLSVDEWDAEWSDETKRQVIASAVFVHRKKGTVAAVREAIRSAGLGEVEIIEGFQPNTHDGAHLYDGEIVYAGPDHWAEYRVVVERIVSIRQAATIRALLRRVAPARSKLKAFDFRQSALNYDGAASYDGTFSHGEA